MNPAPGPDHRPDPAAIADLARRIHAADGPGLALYVAGGGTEVFPWLLARGGGSATLLAGRIPYDRADFVAALGADPGRLVDARAARGLAMAAFRHALRLRPDLGGAGVAGIAATAKLARADGEPERAGRAHEVHLALQTATRTLARSIVLPPGGDRAGQERACAAAILDLVADTRGLPGLPADRAGGTATEVAADACACGHPGLPALLDGTTPLLALRRDADGGMVPEPDPAAAPGRLILPGSFRPLHEGHRRMAAIAAELLGMPCAFELSLFHPEKPPLDYLSIADRVGRFVDAGGDGRLLLTDAPTFRDKARLFPGATFVVGHDTAARIFEPRWYGGVPARDAMLDELEALGTRLLVFGRVDAAGRFRDLALEPIDEHRVAHFVARSVQVVAEEHFRLDLSSTALRRDLGAELP